MATRIQKRRDTATNWAVNNPILRSGEEGFETDTRKTKTGDGTTAWNSLAYDISISDVIPQSLTNVLETENIASKEIDMNGYSIQNVANPVEPSDAANKSYVDNKTINLRNLLGSIDCSTNPDYPSGNVGDTYEVIIAGKIGGDGGIDVAAWDEIVCSEINAGGSQAAVGTSWYIVQGNVLDATQYVSGTIRIATDEEVNEGAQDNSAVTPKSLLNWLNAVISNLFQSKEEKNETDGYVGLKDFTIVFKNAANTFLSYFSNSNTASRTYGFPDKSGTVAMLDDISSAVSSEASTRATADTALSSSIVSEASTRATVDTALSSSIASEASARSAADLTLAASIPTRLPRKIHATCIIEVVGTATTSEELYWSHKINALEVVDGDTVEIDPLFLYNSAISSQKQFYIRAHTANAIGGTILANIQNNNGVSADTYVKLSQKIKIKFKASPAQTMEASYGNTGAYGIMTAFASANIPLNADWYIIISAKKAATADIITLKYADLYINKQ